MADVDVFVELFKKPALEVFFNNSHIAMGMIDDIRFVDSMTLSNLDIEKELYEQSFSYKQYRGRCKKFAKKISKFIKPYELPVGMQKILVSEIQDDELRHKVLVETLQHYCPNLEFKAEDLRYELEFINDTEFKIHSNLEQLDVDLIQFSEDTTIMSLITACEDLQVMSENNSEISVPSINSKILQTKIDITLSRTLSNKEIEVFDPSVLNEAWDLSSAINQKKIHLKPVLELLRKAERYKPKLQDNAFDIEIIIDYIEKFEEKSILQKLPAKSIRFYLFTALSLIVDQIQPGTAIPMSFGLSTFDNFLLDHLIEKWCPNQLIEKETELRVYSKT